MSNNQKIVFITFGDTKYKPALKRIKHEAKASGFFTKIKILSNRDLGKKFLKENKEKLCLRGFGYWMWKSYIINNEIKKINLDDIIVYLDAGCTINYKAKQRFLGYINLVNETKTGILVFEQEGLLEKNWTKSDLLEFTDSINDDAIINTPQICGGIFIIRKNPISEEFINNWCNLCNNHFDLITDKPSRCKNFPEFIEHRHDQSAFSVLVKKYNPCILSASETYTEGDFQSELSCFPFWATRKRTYYQSWISLKVDGIKRRIKRFVNSISSLIENFQYEKDKS